ncbi:MAG TPA: flagellar regulator YcgR PilZN domain-containing protein, partial [Burkholderiaceae bacterium]|nr:flagellar regulator YcgR PilZN domain-containing protein [Burkholderiaceae bacterium]
EQDNRNRPSRAMDTTPFPEAEAPALERYWLYSKFEIETLIARVCDERLPMTVYWGSNGQFAVTQIMKVDAVHNELHFDMPNTPQQQYQLLEASELTFVAFIESIKLQFTLEAPRRSSDSGYPTFHCAMPDRVLRLQRREYYRVRTPDAVSASCLVPYSGDRAQYESLRVLDVSVGGLAMLAYPRHFDPSQGTVIDRCYLDLPGVGTVTVRLRVAHVEASHDELSRRCGCEFIDLSPQARMMLQRYVHRIDVEQRQLRGPDPRKVA